MTKPSEPARALLDAWAAQHGPPPEVADRAWAAIQTRAAQGDLGPELATSTAGRVGVGVRLKLILGGLAGLCLAAAIGLALIDGDPNPIPPDEVAATEPEPVAALATQPTVRATNPPSLNAKPVAPSASVEPEPPQAKDRTRRSPPPATVASEDTLAAEMKLLGAARAALKQGDVDEALRQLAAHAKQFPKGALASEREQSRVTALCEAGRSEDARRVAKAYAKKHPSSPLAKQADSPCL